MTSHPGFQMMTSLCHQWWGILQDSRLLVMSYLGSHLPARSGHNQASFHKVDQQLEDSNLAPLEFVYSFQPTKLTHRWRLDIIFGGKCLVSVLLSSLWAIHTLSGCCHTITIVLVMSLVGLRSNWVAHKRWVHCVKNLL